METHTLDPKKMKKKLILMSVIFIGLGLVFFIFGPGKEAKYWAYAIWIGYLIALIFGLINYKRLKRGENRTIRKGFSTFFLALGILLLAIGILLILIDGINGQSASNVGLGLVFIIWALQERKKLKIINKD